MRMIWIVVLAAILPGARAGADDLRVGRASVEIIPAEIQLASGATARTRAA